MHIVSGIDGELAAGKDAFDLFAAAFPVGTLVGASKFARGTVGYFGSGGDMDQAITIRTMVFGQGRYNYQAGAGIVAQSVAERENDEVVAKSAVLRHSMELAGEGL